MSRSFLALCGASALALTLAHPALSASLEAASRIDAVTVFPDAAQVTRVSELDLPAGASSVLFRGLPMGLDPGSIRVEGAEAGLQIGSVEARVSPAQQEPMENSLQERLRRLAADREGVQARLAALAAKKTMIERYAQASPEKLGENSAPLDVEKWAQAWDAVGVGLAKLGDETQTARQRLADIEQEIRALQASNRMPAQRTQPTRDITVEVEAGTAAKTRLVLIYRVGGAGWQAAYDARLESKGANPPDLQLVRRAQVSQRTGEDWTNVELSVSTVRTQRGTQAPEVPTQRVRFFEPPPPIALSRPAPRAARMEASGVAPAAPVAGSADEPKEEKAREVEATIEASTYEAQFRIPGRIDVPADGSQRALRIGSQTLQPALIVKTSPSIDATAYLEASFVNKEEAPLLPGPVMIQRDGMFVGRGVFRLVAPGEEAKLGFGADDRVKVTRVPLSRRENTPGWLGANRTERQDFRTTIRNLHPFAVKLAVVDRLPVSEDASIVIEPLSTNTAPTEKIFEDRRGVMGWTFDLAPNASREIRLGWQLRWPKEKQIVTETLPSPAQ